MRSTDAWRVVSGRNGGGIDRCGLTAHRSVLHPDEYADGTLVLGVVERELGFSTAELRSVYRQGRLSAAQAALRTRIDATAARGPPGRREHGAPGASHWA